MIKKKLRSILKIYKKNVTKSKIAIFSMMKKIMAGAINFEIARKRKKRVEERDKLPIMLKKIGLNGEGVEIGVLRGDFSEKILKNSNLSRLYSVDSWTFVNKDEYKESLNYSQELHENNYLFSIIRLMKFGKRSVCLRMKSKDASSLFTEGQLDFVYIDANHSYKACSEDLRLWWPKLKKGGIFSGHDYVNEKVENAFFEVKKAVDEFAKKNNLKVKIIKEKKIYNSWYIIK